MEAVLAYLKVLSWHSLGDIEENYKPYSGKLAMLTGTS
jgi:hypothetical protein